MAEMDIQREAAAFRTSVETRQAEARQIAALQLACGMDLASALSSDPETLGPVVKRLERAIERERLRGLRRHWSYDLNRHIALKEVLDRLHGRLRTAEPETAVGSKTDKMRAGTR